MQRLLGDIRRCDEDYHLIPSGAHVALGVSGGKDSLVLLCALARYRDFQNKSFSLDAVTIKMGDPFDTSGISALCASLHVPYTVEETDLFHIIFDERKEKNPCALCAKMRRGALVRLTKKLGCDTLALAHHRDDALETLAMSVLHEARFHTFPPRTFLDDNEVTVIRPMLYASEGQITNLAKKMSLPVLKNPCPADGHTTRQEMKELLDELNKKYPRAKEYMLAALKNDEEYGLWSKE